MNSEESRPSQQRSTVTEDRSPDYRFYEQEMGNSQPPVGAPLSRSNQQAQYYRELAVAKDEKELGQLALGYQIYGGIHAFFSCFPLIYVVIGILMVSGGFGGGRGAPPPEVGWILIIFAGLFSAVSWALVICNFYAGKFLKERRKYMFCFVMSCINCTALPLGTILGVFSLILLSRESVKELFGYETKLK